MAKSKKRKPNPDAQLKLQAAKSLNEYKRRMKDLCIRLGFESKFKMLERDLDLVHRIRPKSMRVTALDDKVSDYFLECIRSHFDYSMKELKIPAYEGGPLITHGDYHQLIEPLRVFLEIRKEDDHPLAAAFAPILQSPEKENESIILDLAHRIEMFGMSESNFIDRFFHVTASIGHTEKGGSPRETLYVEVSSEPPSWKQIRIGAGRRIAARMGFSFPKTIEWMRVRPSKLGIRCKPENDKPLDVYILQHAAQRLYQRIGGKHNDLMNMDMILSLFDLRAFPTRGGNILIEHRIHKVKVGYYVATITDGVLLIRTFLLLTHTGTPEGRKLTTLTGLSKWDHKYMSFDSLPALAASDLLKNEETRKIFIEAGCEGLFSICERMLKRSEHYHISDKQNMVADKLLQYIKQGKEEVSDLWDNTPDELNEESLQTADGMNNTLMDGNDAFANNINIPAEDLSATTDDKESLSKAIASNFFALYCFCCMKQVQPHQNFGNIDKKSLRRQRR
jgi:hypothetical protein